MKFELNHPGDHVTFLNLNKTIKQGTILHKLIDK